jgi:hypothetical protein
LHCLHCAVARDRTDVAQLDGVIGLIEQTRGAAEDNRRGVHLALVDHVGGKGDAGDLDCARDQHVFIIG